MKAEYINPFLEAATIVIEQVVQIRPSTGKLGLKNIEMVENHIWIQIGINGQMNGDIVFGLSEQVALKMVSAMMGGFIISELDEIGRSAISELGNMISGNASTMLYNQGVSVDITPPRIIQSASAESLSSGQALTVPLIMDGIGQFDIQVLVAS
ncbi:chemotaxis protein CheX [Paenibacillus glycanilyticus]|uniref:CheY-P phosphatase CheX n=1 Tax=Paenibacillus glycanilyticus TaxID=126569 RepID=A0ABQ6GCW1_9BACL|nr:chemotaxis protein CheX [Paenibacillus glycanilyticus]GLX67113.1 CheY-P phosphatase CheX [Paenibacillus glycanilyticus]